MIFMLSRLPAVQRFCVIMEAALGKSSRQEGAETEGTIMGSSALGAARCGLLLALCVLGLAPAARAATFFVEGETFQVTGDGWRTDAAVGGEEERYCQPPASGMRALRGATGAGDSTASTTLTLPAAGVYRLHVRYFLAPERGPFHVDVLQQGQVIAGKDFDVEKRADVEVWNYVWDALDARLAAGETVVRVSKYRQQNCSTLARWVDCIELTDDTMLVPDHLKYGPQTWLRITLDEGYERPMYFYAFADHYRGPWYDNTSISKAGFESALTPGREDAYLRNAGDSTGWVNVTRTVYPDSGAILMMSPRYSYTEVATRFKGRIDVASEPDEARIVKTFRRDAEPATMYLILPPNLQPENLRYLQMDLDAANATGTIADAAAWPTFGRQPTRFPFFVTADFTSGWGKELDRAVIEREKKTLGYFGFSNLLPMERIGGLWQYMKTEETAPYGCYSQPDIPAMTAAAKSAAEEFTKRGGNFSNIVNCMLMDEPWGQPLAEIVNCPSCNVKFRAWMRELFTTPTAVNAASWDEVKIVTEEQRNARSVLYYYSQQFRTRALSAVMRVQRDILQKAYGNTNFPVDCNFSDGAVYFSNLYGLGIDYFLLMDSDEQNAIWSEDWGNSAASTQCTSYNVELMRSAAMKRGQTVGQFLIAYAGRLPWDIKLKAISELARNVKAFENFWYGPSWGGHEGGPMWNNSAWYAKPETWRANAEILREIGGAEDLLFPAKKRKSQTAILYSSSSDIWTVPTTNAYGLDRMFTWLALAHAQVPVDMLSEKMVAEGGLAGYKVCYYTGPNLTKTAAGQLAAWVRRGGTLVMTAGAGLRDEFNRPLPELDVLRPARGGTVDEFEPYQGGGAFITSLTPKEQVSMKGGITLDVLAVKQALLPVPGATVLGSFADGTPAVVQNKYGKGRVQAFGFLPGLAYMWPARTAKAKLAAASAAEAANALPPDPTKILAAADVPRRSGCPWQYPAAIRELLTAPALRAKAEVPVRCGVPLVDAVCMDAPAGIVVPLANYTLQPLATITLAVRSAKAVRTVESVHHGRLRFTQAAGRVTFSLPLTDTDIVKLYYK